MLPYFCLLQKAYASHPYMRDYILWQTNLPAQAWNESYCPATLKLMRNNMEADLSELGWQEEKSSR